MDKMRMESVDITAQNIDKIGAMFPNCITETVDENGKPKKAVNFELLKQMLSGDVIEGDEAYEFTWVGKKAAIVEANKPIRKTLRPCVEESKDWDTTENLYIEGDNLEVMKLLQESYLGKVKMIYIDPPYNTGNDFIYNDDFKMTGDEYADELGTTDEDGNRMFKNTDSNGRFHSDWCSMIYSRLMLARNLLTDDGVIFISISEEEVHTLKQICNEVFGAVNFRNAIFTRRYDKNLNRQFMEQGLATMNTGLEYILMYSKRQTTTYNPVFRPSSEERSTQGYWKGFWNDADRPTMRYDVLGVTPESGQWKWKRELADEAVKNYIEYSEKHSANMTLEEYWESTGKTKKFIRRNPNGRGKNKGVEHWIAPADGILRNTNWSDLLASKPTGTDVPFDSPKNIEVISELIKISNIEEDGIVLDFFSGSATTAHAVMQLNAEEKQNLVLSIQNLDTNDPEYESKFQALNSKLSQTGNRKFIMVQLPEATDEKSEAYKAGYKNICEIGKERIRRAGKKILEHSLENLEKEGVIEKYARELSEIRSLEEVYGSSGNDLFLGEKTAEGGDLRSVGSNSKSGSLDPVKHCRGTVSGEQRICPFFENSKGITSRSGNTIVDLRTLEILNEYGYRIKFEATGRDQQNALFSDKELNNQNLELGNQNLELGNQNLELGNQNLELGNQNLDFQLQELSSKLSVLSSKLSPLSSDYGFRVLKLDDSNMTDVYYSADEYNQDMLSMLESNVKPDRTDLDLLFGCLLEWGLPLSMPYYSEVIDGCNIHTYGISKAEADSSKPSVLSSNNSALSSNNSALSSIPLIACFNDNIPESVVKEIARRKPLRAVFRDSGFASSPAKINVTEIFKLLAPDTRVKVL